MIFPESSFDINPNYQNLDTLARLISCSKTRGWGDCCPNLPTLPGHGVVVMVAPHLTRKISKPSC